MNNHDGYNKKTGRPTFCGDGNNSVIFELLGDSPTIRLWIFLWENEPLNDSWSKKQIADLSGISRPSLYKIWDKFTKYDFIIPSKKYKGKQLYKCDHKNPFVKKMFKLMAEYCNYNISIYLAIENEKDQFALDNKGRLKRTGKKLKKNMAKN